MNFLTKISWNMVSKDPNDNSISIHISHRQKQMQWTLRRSNKFEIIIYGQRVSSHYYSYLISNAETWCLWILPKSHNCQPSTITWFHSIWKNIAPSSPNLWMFMSSSFANKLGINTLRLTLQGTIELEANVMILQWMVPNYADTIFTGYKFIGWISKIAYSTLFMG